MLEFLMYGALGFLTASVLAVLLAPPLWRRAVRLTTRRIEATMPMTVADIQADKDELRAEFAIKLRQLELALEKAKDQAARNLVERNRNQVLARQYREEVIALKEELSARSSQTAVLQQNVSDRIPQLEAQNAKAHAAIAAREAELERLKRTLASQSEALTKAKQELEKQQRGETAPIESTKQRLSSSQEMNSLQEENHRLVTQMTTLRERLSSADAQALEALKTEKQRIESELEELKNERAALERQMAEEAGDGSDLDQSLQAENELLTDGEADLEKQLAGRHDLREGDIGALRREMQDLADQIMAKAKDTAGPSGRRSPARPPQAKSPRKSTGKVSRNKSAADEEPRVTLTQQSRELADSQAD